MEAFVVAEALHRSLAEVRAMPNSEVVEWMAFFAVRRAQAEVEK